MRKGCCHMAAAFSLRKEYQMTGKNERKLKKWAALFLAAAMSLTACGSTDTAAKDETPSAPPVAQPEPDPTPEEVRRTAAEHRMDAGKQFARVEGFGDVVVGAELKTDNTVLDLALSRQHDDGDIRGIANGAANALAGDLGEHKVEHDQVKLMLLELLDRGLAVADAHNPVAFALEIGSDGVTDCLLILDQQNLFCI